MFENNLIAGVSGQGGGYSINDSLRFNDDDSAYLSRTPSVTSDRKTWTWSAWVKRGNLSTAQFNTLICSDSGADPDRFYFGRSSTNPDKLILSLADTYSLTTTQVFRDASGWYHIAVVVDTTQATSSDRVKLYVNGEQITTFSSSSYPPLNYDTQFNWTSRSNFIGARTGGSDDFDGYMAEINFIDGQALTPDNFGEINEDTGEWSPIEYEGTYGTNGFYLPFDGNSNDSSGNGNNWTENNLASTDYMIDTPTNNFAALNSIATTMALSEGNLKETTNVTGNWQSAISTMGVSSGKWYFETCAPQALTAPPYAGIGITTDSNFGAKSGANYLGNSVDSWSYITPALKFTNGSSTAYGSAFTNGDVIGCALDMDAGTVTFYKNNVSQGVAFTGLTGTMFCGSTCYAASGTTSNNINFGQDSSFAGNKTRQGNTDANGIGDFYYTPPTGYLALCTDNLPAPTIEQPETHFNVVTYTGNGADRNIDLGFAADLVWIKVRSQSFDHALYDRVRGNNSWLFPNSTSTEANLDDGISFDYANGFNIDNGANSTYYNLSGYTYVAWCWKAGGTAVSNTDGSITSQVSANVDAGFSIVSYTGTGANATVGHGLDSAPDVVIYKRRVATDNWQVSISNITGTTGDRVFLNLTLGKRTDTTREPTKPSSSVLSVGGLDSPNSESVIAYCFHSVESFSKIGSYIGNGSTNGPYIYTGFKPAFVMVKRIDSDGRSWFMYDNKRDTDNVVQEFLVANDPQAEVSLIGLDFTSNGFKWRGSDISYNASGGTYIYMAFAEHPFQFSTGR